MVMLSSYAPLTEKLRNNCPALPAKTRSAPEFTLVLDLDETLVHCSLTPLEDAVLIFTVDFQQTLYQVYVRLRPFLKTFLRRMAKYYEIILFTASKKIYANKLLDILDASKNYVRHRLFREHCVCVYGNYVKDLTIVGRDLSKTIIIDNAAQSFSYQVENGIPIESWFQEKTDRELMKLVPLLEMIPFSGRDVRDILREKYRLRELMPLNSNFWRQQQQQAMIREQQVQNDYTQTNQAEPQTSQTTEEGTKENIEEEMEDEEIDDEGEDDEEEEEEEEEDDEDDELITHQPPPPRAQLTQG